MFLPCGIVREFIFGFPSLLHIRESFYTRLHKRLIAWSFEIQITSDYYPILLSFWHFHLAKNRTCRFGRLQEIII